jgi:hypothetical protein
MGFEGSSRGVKSLSRKSRRLASVARGSYDRGVAKSENGTMKQRMRALF